MPAVAGGCSTAPFNSSCCAWSRAGGEPPVCSNIRAAGPPSPKADAQRPIVWGSRSSASAVAAAVKPWASSRMAYHLSRSRGVGAKITRRRKSLTPICHCSRDRSISLTPITNPSQFLRPATSVPSPRFLHKFTPCVCAFHLGFGLVTKTVSVVPMRKQPRSLSGD